MRDDSGVAAGPEQNYLIETMHLTRKGYSMRCLGQETRVVAVAPAVKEILLRAMRHTSLSLSRMECLHTFPVRRANAEFQSVEQYNLSTVVREQAHTGTMNRNDTCRPVAISDADELPEHRFTPVKFIVRLDGKVNDVPDGRAGEDRNAAGFGRVLREKMLYAADLGCEAAPFGAGCYGQQPFGVAAEPAMKAVFGISVQVPNRICIQIHAEHRVGQQCQGREWN